MLSISVQQSIPRQQFTEHAVWGDTERVFSRLRHNNQTPPNHAIAANRIPELPCQEPNCRARIARINKEAGEAAQIAQRALSACSTSMIATKTPSCCGLARTHSLASVSLLPSTDRSSGTRSRLFRVIPRGDQG